MKKDQAAQSQANSFDLADFDAIDETTMEVALPDGSLVGWQWIFAGPGHPKAEEQSNRMMRERLRKEAAQEQAQVNGKKWKAEDETPEEALARNIRVVTERLLGWSPMKMNGEDYPFTEANARAILADRRKSFLLVQALEFLGNERAFMKRSAGN